MRTWWPWWGHTRCGIMKARAGGDMVHLGEKGWDVKQYCIGGRMYEASVGGLGACDVRAYAMRPLRFLVERLVRVAVQVSGCVASSTHLTKPGRGNANMG
jgi:hypothetical protein